MRIPAAYSIYWVPNNTGLAPQDTPRRFRMRLKELSPERIEFLKKDYSQGFSRYCGFEILEVAWGRFTTRVVSREDLIQQDGFIHAGVMATMADQTAGYSAFTTVPEDYRILTIEFKINFLRPAFGAEIVCKSHVIREGRQIIVAESEILDVRAGGAQVPVAKAMVTLMVVHQDSLKR
jgi:uncharacterized protein (TIGR00369 family)